MAWRSIRAASTRLLRERLELRVENVQNLPPTGPVIIAARHFHHLYDGAVMMSIVPRPLRILVGLDWVRNPVGKVMMERLCGVASWPVVMGRGDTLPSHDRETSRALRHAISDSLKTLRDGDALLVFPEGYPNIDPGYTPKEDESVFLPFQPGFVRLATIAATQGLEVPILPVGLSYIRNDLWEVVVRFGEPISLTHRGEERSVLQQVEAEVHRLSQEPLPGT